MYNKQYIPILKWKAGEASGLGNVSAIVKQRITPLIEIVPIPQDLDTEEDQRTLEEHVDHAIRLLERNWGTNYPFFLDAGSIASLTSANGISGAEHTLNQAATSGLQFIPVVGLQRPPSELAAALNWRQRGICLRLTLDDLESTSISNDVQAFIAIHQLQPADIDLIMDLGYIDWPQPIALRTIRHYIASLPHILGWRTLTVASTSFPKSMQGIPTNQTTRQVRLEWLIWSALYQSQPGLVRIPDYGDYGIQNPELIDDFDPRYMDVSSTIRYTTDREWVLVRGVGNKRVPAKQQYPGLAGQLLALPLYYGAQHCQGCYGIQQCNAGVAGYGNATAWRKVGTTHHLTVVTNQLAALFWPSGIGAPHP